MRRSADGSRHVDAGVHGTYAFLNRGGTAHPDTSGTWLESRSPYDPAAKGARLRILVDRTTVEMFVDGGRYLHSQEAFPLPEDTGVSLFTVGGSALFARTVIREFG